MASTFSKVPSVLFGSGYAFDGTFLKIPIANLPRLTSSLADATTGDGRAIVFSILDAVYNNNSAVVVAGNGSDRLAVSKSNGAADNNGIFTTAYGVNIQLSVGTPTVPAE
jgi:hypothetical protein